MFTLADIREDFKWQRELERRKQPIRISEREYKRISHRQWGMPTGVYFHKIWRADTEDGPVIVELALGSKPKSGKLPDKCATVVYPVIFDETVEGITSEKEGDYGFRYPQLLNRVYTECAH